MPTITEQIKPTIPLQGEPSLSQESVLVGPTALAVGTLLGVDKLDDELAVPWLNAADPLPAFVVGVVRTPLAAAAAGVTQRAANIVAGNCLLALDTLPVLRDAKTSAPAHYRQAVRMLSARGARIVERN